MLEISQILSNPSNVGNLLISCIMVVLFVVTIGIHIPRRREWGQFRTAVRLVGAACLLLAINYIASAFFPFETTDGATDLLVSLTTVDGAMFQALLFTMISIVLILPDVVHWPQMMRHLAVAIGMTIITIGGYVLFPTMREHFVVVACIFYSGYITYLTILFRRSFNLAVRHLETIYDDDMRPRLLWVRVFFYGALFVGVMALVTAVFPSKITVRLFDISVPVYYSFAVVRLMNYVVTSAYVVKVPVPKRAEAPLQADYLTPSATAEAAAALPSAPEPQIEDSFQAVRQALDQWVKSRGYAQGDMTVEEIITELGVSRPEFLAYFKNVLGTQFRTWRRHIRIEAAMRLIDADPAVSVSEIIESVGYSDRSNFHKHFQSVAGMSLREYRETVTHSDK